jgi:hypothetical protein
MNTHGGKRKGSGRKKTGREQIKIRIKSTILEQLQPGAASKLRKLIEEHYP